MPTYGDSWDETVPAGNSVRSLGDDAIRSFKRAIRERVGTDINLKSNESGDSNIGYHKQCTFIETAALPSTATGITVLGAETHPVSGKPELCHKDEDGTKCFITKDGKIDGKYFGNLANIPDTAGNIPLANLGNVVGVVPVGGIIMWSGTIANIPTNWALCNGSNGTPDLRDRMVICAKQDESGSAKTNVTGSLTVSGGSATHTLTISEVPAHTHGLKVGFQGTGAAQAKADTGDGDTVVQTNSTESSGGGAAHNNMPPYYSLALIMRTA